MQHFVSFSNSVRKSFTRQKQATLLGQNAPSTSYVDQIQTARRGKISPIDSSYYISRDEAMTHPKDNRFLVATQRKFQELTSPNSVEYGVKLYRPNYSKATGTPDLYRNSQHLPKKDELVVGNIVKGKADTVDIDNSYPRKIKSDAMVSRFYGLAGEMHSHPNNTFQPSIADMERDSAFRTQTRKNHQSLIFTPHKQGFTITDYKQRKPLTTKVVDEQGFPNDRNSQIDTEYFSGK
jgi:hypothetical protein